MLAARHSLELDAPSTMWAREARELWSLCVRAREGPEHKSWPQAAALVRFVSCRGAGTHLSRALAWGRAGFDAQACLPGCMRGKQVCGDARGPRSVRASVLPVLPLASSFGSARVVSALCTLISVSDLCALCTLAGPRDELGNFIVHTPKLRNIDRPYASTR